MSSIGMGNGGTGCFGGVEPAITNGARSSVLPSAWWYVPSSHSGLAPSSRRCTLHLTLGISHQHAIQWHADANLGRSANRSQIGEFNVWNSV